MVGVKKQKPVKKVQNKKSTPEKEIQKLADKFCPESGLKIRKVVEQTKEGLFEHVVVSYFLYGNILYLLKIFAEITNDICEKLPTVSFELAFEDPVNKQNAFIIVVDDRKYLDRNRVASVMDFPVFNRDLPMDNMIKIDLIFRREILSEHDVELIDAVDALIDRYVDNFKMFHKNIDKLIYSMGKTEIDVKIEE